jgi:hypothetical protein
MLKASTQIISPSLSLTETNDLWVTKYHRESLTEMRERPKHMGKMH